jgi:hypothetical protein
MEQPTPFVKVTRSSLTSPDDTFSNSSNGIVANGQTLPKPRENRSASIVSVEPLTDKVILEGRRRRSAPGAEGVLLHCESLDI